MADLPLLHILNVLCCFQNIVLHKSLKGLLQDWYWGEVGIISLQIDHDSNISLLLVNPPK